MKKDYKKYGICFLLIWNLLLFLVTVIRYFLGDALVYQQLFFNASDMAFSIGFVLLWSLFWYYIGYSGRKEFVTRRMQFRTLNPLLETEIVDRQFKNIYVAHYTGILYKVTIALMPIYVLIRREFCDIDFVVLSLLLVLSIFFFYVHKKTAKKGRGIE